MLFFKALVLLLASHILVLVGLATRPIAVFGYFLHVTSIALPPVQHSKHSVTGKSNGLGNTSTMRVNLLMCSKLLT